MPLPEILVTQALEDGQSGRLHTLVYGVRIRHLEIQDEPADAPPASGMVS